MTDVMFGKEYIVKVTDDGECITGGELIRCKECKYFINSDEQCQLINTRLHFYEIEKRWTEESFCSWAVRQDNGKNTNAYNAV